MAAVNWHTYIHADPDILRGKPVVRGTRLSVEFVLGLFSAGWSEQQVLDNYPTLSSEALQAVFAFAAETLREESLYAFPDAADGWFSPTRIFRLPAFDSCAQMGLTSLR